MGASAAPRRMATNSSTGSHITSFLLPVQLRGGLQGVSAKDMLSRVVIAYEPVWAIGTGLSATPAIAQCIHAYIRSQLAELYGPEIAAAVRIQYGGSVTPETVDELMACPDIDGCLVGGASLAADKFARIFSFQPPAPGGPRKLYASEVVPSGCTLGESVVWSERLQVLQTPGRGVAVSTFKASSAF